MNRQHFMRIPRGKKHGSVKLRLNLLPGAVVRRGSQAVKTELTSGKRLRLSVEVIHHCHDALVRESISIQRVGMHFEEPAISAPPKLRLEKIRVDVDQSQLWNSVIDRLPDRGLNQRHHRVDIGIHSRDAARLIDDAHMPKRNFRLREAGFVGNGVLEKLLRHHSTGEIVHYNDRCRIR